MRCFNNYTVPDLVGLVSFFFINIFFFPISRGNFHCKREVKSNIPINHENIHKLLTEKYLYLQMEIKLELKISRRICKTKTIQNLGV